ncbi:hypothetical protein INR49_029328, partial [Caranx melampygus]
MNVNVSVPLLKTNNLILFREPVARGRLSELICPRFNPPSRSRPDPCRTRMRRGEMDRGPSGQPLSLFLPNPFTPDLPQPHGP